LQPETLNGHLFEKKLPDSQPAVLEEPQLNEAFIINLNRPVSEPVQEVLHHRAIPGSQ
jgi:gluconate kinase